MLKLYPTQHAVERARDRTGWSREALVRMLERVFYFGLGPESCRGPLRRFLELKGLEETSPVIRLYGDHVFVFGHGFHPDEMALITILHLPLELRPLAHRARAKSLALAA